ncbi:hypothetical protein [Priestia sp. FSL R5-0680]|uniref:hypothetical protein n=1 Tax=Priestia sp. FSL R5-0680 TaxID=2921582 RepID=UPI0030F9CE9F
MTLLYKYKKEYAIQVSVDSTLLFPFKKIEDIKPLLNEGNYHLYAICKKKVVKFETDIQAKIENGKLKTILKLATDSTGKNFDEFRGIFDLEEVGKPPYSISFKHDDKEIIVLDSDGKTICEAWANFLLQGSLDQLAHTLISNGEYIEAMTVENRIRDLSLEVLYIGQAYGSNGERDAYKRLMDGHEKLTQAMIDIIDNPGEELWIMLFSLDDKLNIYSKDINDPISTDVDKSNDHSDNVKNFNVKPKHLLHAVEAAMIGYFNPIHNHEFKNTSRFPTKNKKYQDVLDLDCNSFCLLMNSRLRQKQAKYLVSPRIFTSDRTAENSVHTVDYALDFERVYMLEDLPLSSHVLFIMELNELEQFEVLNPINIKA